MLRNVLCLGVLFFIVNKRVRATEPLPFDYEDTCSTKAAKNVDSPSPNNVVDGLNIRKTKEMAAARGLVSGTERWTLNAAFIFIFALARCLHSIPLFILFFFFNLFAHSFTHCGHIDCWSGAFSVLLHHTFVFHRLHCTFSPFLLPVTLAEMGPTVWAYNS